MPAFDTNRTQDEAQGRTQDTGHRTSSSALHSRQSTFAAHSTSYCLYSLAVLNLFKLAPLHSLFSPSFFGLPKQYLRRFAGGDRLHSVLGRRHMWTADDRTLTLNVSFYLILFRLLLRLRPIHYLCTGTVLAFSVTPLYCPILVHSPPTSTRC